jgi:hypothetical protein
MNKAEQLRELESRAKGNIEAMFLAMQTKRDAGVFKMALEAAIEAAEALTRSKKRS